MVSSTHRHLRRILLVRSIKKSRRRRVHRGPNRHRNRGHCLLELASLTDSQYTRMFRLDRAAFCQLLIRVNEIAPVVDDRKAIASSGSSISGEIRLAVTLRWLAGASYLDLCFGWGLSVSSFFSVLWSTMEAIELAIPLSYPINDIARLQEIGDEAAAATHGAFSGFAGAIDGLVVRTRSPHKNECDNPAAYRNRKGCFGILCLGVADMRGRFLSFSCKWSGSTHDSYAWSTSSLRMSIPNLPQGCYLIGDDAFANENRLVVPWAGRNLTPAQDSFNYYLSRCRQCIERAFGMLVRRWGVLWRRLSCNFTKWSLVVAVCAKLHNLCCERSIPLLPRLLQDFQPGDEELVIVNDEVLEGQPAHATGVTRRDITSLLETQGIRRPPVPLPIPLPMVR